ncbi:MAG: thymidine kinase [Chitinophagaceae bacterium]|nr:thymidine kinase [Chitinophagaceae bacterium]MCA6453128.1 thymidine kinase [Chitinophagaceae bacterium]MCA6455287.1 thymidine kinase [Chitinophagaceae bacterium]MCA6457824.1 thymidine kinase [Chitinophagaceae bacterium]MCA6463537.1 thymidine kinase [Chitinophagaceae bacterium]
MFIEPNLSGERRGWIEVICGSMFSGKTEELIRRLKRAKIANLKVEIFKPAIDVRYDETNVVSHDANAIQSTPIDNSQTILLLSEGVDVVGIDEAQFFDDEICNVCETLALRGVRVIVAGLDMDYLGKPFGQMPYLLSIADYITKLHAICMQCGNIANVSYRKTAQEEQVLLGEKETYEPRCRKCAHES